MQVGVGSRIVIDARPRSSGQAIMSTHLRTHLSTLTAGPRERYDLAQPIDGQGNTDITNNVFTADSAAGDDTTRVRSGLSSQDGPSMTQLNISASTATTNDGQG